MHKSIAALFAASSLVASTPIYAQSSVDMSNVPTRTGAEMKEGNDLIRGHVAIALVAVVGLILLLLELDDDSDDEETSISP